MSSIHDQTFKELMSQKVFFKGFCQAYMPKDLFEKVNWDSWKLISSDNHYRNRESDHHYISDVLCTLDIQLQKHCVIVHAEHFSYHDPLCMLRIANYQTGAVLKYAESNHLKKCPPVITFLYHQGRRPFKGSLDILDCFVHPHQAALYLFKPILINLPIIPDDELEQHQEIAPAELAFKHIFEEFAPYCRKIARLLQRADRITREILIKYVTETAKMDTGQFTQSVLETLPEEEDKMKTVGQQLREEGRRQAIEEMKTVGQQLREEGRRQAIEEMKSSEEKMKFDIASRFIQAGLDNASIANGTGLTAQQVEALRKNSV